jgi:hypothetical protein
MSLGFIAEVMDWQQSSTWKVAFAWLCIPSMDPSGHRTSNILSYPRHMVFTRARTNKFNWTGNQLNVAYHMLMLLLLQICGTQYPYVLVMEYSGSFKDGLSRLIVGSDKLCDRAVSWMTVESLCVSCSTSWMCQFYWQTILDKVILVINWQIKAYLPRGTIRGGTQETLYRVRFGLVILTCNTMRTRIFDLACLQIKERANALLRGWNEPKITR